MHLFLRKLLRDYRDDAGCPPPAEPDWEPPCRTCRATDAVLAEVWQPLAWGTDGPIVAELEDGRFVTIESAGSGWRWRLESQDGWTPVVLGEGTDESLADAIYAAERFARGL